MRTWIRPINTKVLSVVRSLVRQGFGVLPTTHNPNSALVYGGRVVLLRAGRILAQGRARDGPSASLAEEGLRHPLPDVGDGTGPRAILPSLKETLT
ncbi:MAG: hypothetical protein ACK42E_05065 [Candidatus Bipolaricaulaceae bacterium]